MARAMSLTCIKGLHGDPSLRIEIFFEATAPATKSLSTKSSLSRSLIPHAVANRKQLILNFASARGATSLSVHTLDFAYAVNGLTGDSSVRDPSSAAPYTLQLEA